MNIPDSHMPLTRAPAAVLLRPAVTSDQAFLDALYLSTRDDLQALAGDPALRPTIAALIAMQQQAQATGYRAAYPGAEYLVIEHGGAAVGRVVVHADDGSLRLVDISVLPAARGHGCATAVLSQLQQRAAGAAHAMHLTVRRDNAGARRLYQRLGFAIVADDALDLHLRWQP